MKFLSVVGNPQEKNTSRLRVSFAVKNEMLFSVNRINIYRLTKEWDYCNNFGMSSKQAGKGDSNFRRTLKQNASESEGDVAGSIALELPPKKQKTISPSTLTATVTVRKSKVVAVRKSSTDIPRIQRKLAALWPNSSSIIMQIVRNRRTRVEKDGASSQG